ncbi:MAG: ATP-binding protein, partial [Anaerolineae bacterium]
GISSHALYTALGWAWHNQSRAHRLLVELRDRRGELMRALAALTEATRRLQRTNAELEIARQQAEEARQIKSRFVANISHELRTPLNIIVGFAEMLCTSPETYGGVAWPTELRQDVLTIWRNAEHVLRMIDDVLDLAQIEASRLPVVPEPTDLVQLVRETLETSGPLVKDAALELRCALPEGSVMVHVDRTRIRQVLNNLINNAVRFTLEGFVEVGLCVEGGEAIVHVSDSGEGIPEAKLEVIFDEFEQADSSLRRRHGGTGLGLAISREFVGLHGGRIWAQSKVREGSTFFFSLPLGHASTGIGYHHLLRTPAHKVVSYTEGSVVALCRDNLTLRILARHLDTSRLITADSLASAAQLIKTHHPDTVLVVVEPQEGLSEALRLALELQDAIGTIEVPIVACNIPTERRAGLLLGVDEFLLKPVMREQVVSSVRSLCPEPRRILVLEDQPEMLDLLARILADEWPRAEVIAAASGEQALSALGRRPDVAVLDLLMPGTNGLDVLTAIRANPDTAETRVVAVTARAAAQDLSAPRTEQVGLLKWGGFTASEVVRLVQAISVSLPPAYVGGVEAFRDTPEPGQV